MNNCLLFVLISLIVYIPSFNASGSYSSSSGGRISRFDRERAGSGYNKNNEGYSRYADNTNNKGGYPSRGSGSGSGTSRSRDRGDKSDYIEKLLISVLKQNIDLSKRIEGLESDLADAENNIINVKNQITVLSDDLDASPIIPLSVGVIRAVCVNGPPGQSGTTDGSTTTEDLRCPAGYTGFIGPDGENDIGGGSPTIMEFFELDHIEECATMCRADPTCLAFNWIIVDLAGDSIEGPVFECDIYSSAVPTVNVDDVATFNPEAIIFCVLDDPPCMPGVIYTWSGSDLDLPEYLIPADGSQVSNDDYSGICDILGEIYGDDDDTNPDTCLLPDLNGKFLLTSGDGTSSQQCKGLDVSQAECFETADLEF